MSHAAVQPLSDRAILGALRQLERWDNYGWQGKWTSRIKEFKAEIYRREREDLESENPIQYTP